MRFTKNGNNYESDPIFIDGNDFSNISAVVTTSSGIQASVVGDVTNGYKVLIDQNSITQSTNITLKIEGTRNVSLASNYSNPNGGQTLTPTFLDVEPVTSSIEIYGNISAVPLSLKIKKIDSDGSILGDTRFRILKEVNGRYYEIYKQWYKSSEEYRYDDNDNLIRVNCRDAQGGLLSDGFCEINVTGDGFGKYCIEESIAPPGYALSSRRVCKELNASVNTVELTMVNRINSLSIKKVARSNGNYVLLAGSHLVVKDSNGDIARTIDGKKLDWVSTKEAYIIEGLPAGSYVIEEVESPSGYSLTEEIPFEVTSDGTIICENLESTAGLFDNSDTTILVYNDAEVVEVPNTGVKNILFIIFGSLFLISGAGLIGYGIYKNKKLTV